MLGITIGAVYSVRRGNIYINIRSRGSAIVIPLRIPFPMDEMPVKYFTSTIAYMVAYAVYKEATEIEMYGCPLLAKEEYNEQRPCIEFWIGYAMGKGIKVTVHKPTNILTAKPHMGLYGYEWDNWGNIV